ncbi:hypothetical protein [Acinetobacter bereziniae]|uniref:hypothetical protein n=1 Tax=Acinetobacter bereziniae TaxID=106648 RepID=UPI0029534098|nr:hypothetical protein [Acinetobacter bereziniae]MDV8155629.1 hypothetical protein [Acinetobacter bereziniae]
MPKTINKANRVIEGLKREPNSLSAIRESEDLVNNDEVWSRVCLKAYSEYFKQEKNKRKHEERDPNIGCLTRDQIQDLINVNNLLVNYALSISSHSTYQEVLTIKQLLLNPIANERAIFEEISEITMEVRMRALNKIGRFSKLEPFFEFYKIIESATISYYRGNYMGAYLTLVPTIEGIISRWIGFDGTGEKPSFEQLRKFFKNGHLRNPCPGNVLFYDIWYKTCDKILNEHYYKPTTSGESYNNFNRHLAAHLLNNSIFATKENCIRLFLLLDLMSEIFMYENYIDDMRFYVKDSEIELEINLYNLALQQQVFSPEKLLLNSNQGFIS